MIPPSVALLISAPAWRGSGASFGKIAVGLTRTGHRVLLITASKHVSFRLGMLGLRVSEMSLEKTGWREARRIGAELRLMSANVVLVDSPRDLRLASLATLLRPIPLLFRYNLSGRSFPTDLASRLLFTRLSGVVYQSEYARDRASRTSPWLMRLPSRVIANGYDGALLKPDPESGRRFRRKHDLPEAGHVVLSAAALFLDKGYRNAIRAVELLSRQVPVTWLICGDGDERGTIEAEVVKAGLPVRFCGFLDQAALSDAMTAADVILHPAPGELFPNVVAEAMTLARPVVALDSGAAPELIGRDGQAGCLVPEDDPEAAARELEEILRNGTARRAMGEKARERMLTHYPLERMEQAYLDLIDTWAGPTRAIAPPIPRTAP